MENAALDDLAILAFKRPKELTALLRSIESYGTKKVTIFQDYDAFLSPEWNECREIIQEFCKKSANRRHISSKIPLGPHDAMHKLLEACKQRDYRYFTFFEEDVLPSSVLLNAICEFQSIPEKRLLCYKISSISGNNGCLRLKSRSLDKTRFMRTQYFSVWGSCTLMSTISDYLRCTIPPTERLRGYVSEKLGEDELRTLSLHSLRPWFIYDYQFTMMLIESDTFQVVSTNSLLSHIGHGYNSTHFKTEEEADIGVEEKRLARLRFEMGRGRMFEELNMVGDDRGSNREATSFWGYGRINYTYRMIRICGKLLYTIWKGL